MKKGITYISKALAAVMLPALLWGCGSRQNDTQQSDGDVVSETATPLPTDTVATPPPPPVLRFSTPDEAKRYMNESEDSARYSRGILPQMAEDELAYATRLLNNRHDGFIVVDKSRMKVIKFNRFGETEVEYGMACARNYGTKHEKGDNRTPEGFFSVRKVHDSTEWQYVDDDGVKSDKKGEFGPRFIRLNIPGIYSIGIHGTSAPWSIGGRRSHGCIRVTNENIMRLIEMVDSGMPVIVNPGRRDLEVNCDEGYEIPAISTVPGRKAPKLPKEYVAKKKEEEKPAEKADSTQNKTDSINSATREIPEVKGDSIAGVTVDVE